jgi:hypothetical protein
VQFFRPDLWQVEPVSDGYVQQIADDIDGAANKTDDAMPEKPAEKRW